MSTNHFVLFLSRYSLQILLAWLAVYLLVKLRGSGTFVKRFLLLSAAGYVIALLYMTLLSRERHADIHVQLELLWEYRQAFRLEAGKLKIQDMEFALYIANNLLLFVPMGVLLSECCDACRKNAFVRVLSVSCLASALLEINQLVFHIGLFELDDILNNTIGAILGFGFYGLVKKLMQILRRGNRL